MAFNNMRDPPGAVGTVAPILSALRQKYGFLQKIFFWNQETIPRPWLSIQSSLQCAFYKLMNI
jgi:hypothetical protein